jgi:hypothetical protein
MRSPAGVRRDGKPCLCSCHTEGGLHVVACCDGRPVVTGPDVVVRGPYAMGSTACFFVPARYPLVDDAGDQVGWSDGSPYEPGR